MKPNIILENNPLNQWKKRFLQTSSEHILGLLAVWRKLYPNAVNLESLQQFGHALIDMRQTKWLAAQIPFEFDIANYSHVD